MKANNHGQWHTCEKCGGYKQVAAVKHCQKCHEDELKRKTTMNEKHLNSREVQESIVDQIYQHFGSVKSQAVNDILNFGQTFSSVSANENGVAMGCPHGMPPALNDIFPGMLIKVPSDISDKQKEYILNAVSSHEENVGAINDQSVQIRELNAMVLESVGFKIKLCQLLNISELSKFEDIISHLKKLSFSEKNHD